MKKRKKTTVKIIGIIITTLLLFLGFNFEKYESNIQNIINTINQQSKINSDTIYNLQDIPQYSNSPYIEINNNIPNFKEEDYTTKSFEKYSELDVLGRCGVAFANISRETMPKERRRKRRNK